MRLIIGLILLALTLAVIAWEAIDFFEFGEWSLIVFGEIAFWLFPEWLNLAQAVIQRYVAGWIWDPGIQTFLLWPAWPIIGGGGLFFIAWSRRR